MTSWLGGDFALAEDESDAALEAATLNGQTIFVPFALLIRSMVKAIRGDRDRARADGMEALTISERIGWAIGQGQSRYGLGFLELSEGNASHGHRHGQASDLLIRDDQTVPDYERGRGTAHWWRGEPLVQVARRHL